MHHLDGRIYHLSLQICHLLDQHLSSPAENAMCSMQLSSEDQLYSPYHTECAQWFCAGNKFLCLDDRNSFPCSLITKNTRIFLGRDFHWRRMIASYISIHHSALAGLVWGMSLWQNWPQAHCQHSS